MIEGRVTGDAQVVTRLLSMSDAVHQEVRDRIQALLFQIQAQTVRGKLSGDPLHRVTGTLASSIHTQLDDQATSITGQVGTAVRYAHVHEYGGTFLIPAHDRLGRPVREHEAKYPERSFLRSTLRDMSAQIRDSIARAAHQGAKAA